MSNASKKPEGPLTAAAIALERELGSFEDLVGELGRLHVNSDKTLQRARQALESIATYETTLAERLKVFAEAMQSMQARQQQCMLNALEHAKRIQERNDARNALLERVTALGLHAKEINAPMTDLVESETSEGDAAKILAHIQEVGDRLEAVIVEATAITAAARDSDWNDIARDADALKQQLQAARNKVLVARRNVASRAPS